jgi:hypothetical protein
MIRRRSSVILAAIAAAAVAAACNGSVSGPSGGGAQISGRVTNVAAVGSRSSVSSLTALTTGTPSVASNGSSTLKVTITGTNIESEIDGSGRFELNGVPPGAVEIVFSGDGVSATMRITGIEEGDRIEIEVRLEGNRVMVDSERRDHDDDEDDDEGEEENDEFETGGTVSGLTGTCPALTFTLADRTVMTSRGTQFKDDCSRIQNGSRVEVEGRLNGTTITATEVELR